MIAGRHEPGCATDKAEAHAAVVRSINALQRQEGHIWYLKSLSVSEPSSRSQSY